MTLPVLLTNGNGGQLVSNGSVPVSTVNGSVASTALFDSGQEDAFGRLRVSLPGILFDGKTLNHGHAHIWDGSETSGSGTTSTFSADRSDVKLATTTGTAGTRVRQSLRRMNYFSAKSHVIHISASYLATSSGMRKRIGYFTLKNGLFFQSDAGTLSFVTRSYVTGSAVDTATVQSSWNLDRLDGTGGSGLTLDPDKGNILVIDFEWLGVGRVRFGFVIDGKLIYCHAVNNANNLLSVYMTTPNLPIRYEITNGGTGTADLFLHCGCSSVSSEGIETTVGIPYAFGSDSSSTLSGTANTWAMAGIRLRSDRLDTVVTLTGLQGYATSSDGILVTLHHNPTINGSPTWSNDGGSSVQGFQGGGTSLDITAVGHVLYKFAVYGKTENIVMSMKDLPILGTYIDDTPTELIIGMKALTSNPKALAFISWRES